MREMKESNIPWVGPIPKEWNVGRIKQGYDVTLGKMYAAKEQQKEDGTLENYLCAANIKWAGIDTSVHKQMYFTEKEKEQYLLNNGDAVVMEGGMAGTTCLYKGEYYPCYIQNSVHKISSKNNNSTSFFAYWMEVVCSSGYVENVCNKATIMHYTKDKVCNTPLLLIPVEEQNEIVGYLNEKCSVINSSISRHQQIIEKLEEYRKSVITQAVTKGLNPEVGIKQTGNEWIPEVPAKWNVVQMKYVLQSGKEGLKIGPFGSALKGKTLADGPYKIYNQAHLISGDFTLNRHFVSAETFEELQSYEVMPGDILFSMMGTIGKCRIMPKGLQRGLMDSHLLKGRLNDLVDPEYLIYVYDKDNSSVVINQLLKLSTGSIMNGLNSSILKSIVIPLPPVDVQKQIVAELNKRTNNIDLAINQHQQLIGKLQEYKQSLIYNAVTGKIDCRTAE